jgi:hypothetical protein
VSRCGGFTRVRTSPRGASPPQTRPRRARASIARVDRAPRDRVVVVVARSRRVAAARGDARQSDAIVISSRARVARSRRAGLCGRAIASSCRLGARGRRRETDSRRADEGTKRRDEGADADEIDGMREMRDKTTFCGTCWRS